MCFALNVTVYLSHSEMHYFQFPIDLKLFHLMAETSVEQKSISGNADILFILYSHAASSSKKKIIFFLFYFFGKRIQVNSKKCNLFLQFIVTKFHLLAALFVIIIILSLSLFSFNISYKLSTSKILKMKCFFFVVVQ